MSEFMTSPSLDQFIYNSKKVTLPYNAVKTQELYLLNVPHDNNSGLVSIIIAHLSNFYEEQTQFNEEAKKIFGKNNLKDASYKELYDILGDLKKTGQYDKLKPYLLNARTNFANHIKNNGEAVVSHSNRTLNLLIIEDVKKTLDLLNDNLSFLLKKLQTEQDKQSMLQLHEEVKETNQLIKKAGDYPLDFYIDRLKKDKTYCGKVEFLIFSSLTKCDINIHLVEKSEPLKVISPTKDTTKPDINIQVVNGNHFNCFTKDLHHHWLVNQLTNVEKAISENNSNDDLLQNQMVIEALASEREALKQEQKKDYYNKPMLFITSGPGPEQYSHRTEPEQYSCGPIDGMTC